MQFYAEHKPLGDISAEQLIHKVLFHAPHDEIRLIKILVTAAWHWQPYEEYAETVAKIVGFKYNELSRRLSFENMRKDLLSTMWLPSYGDQSNLIRDIRAAAKIEGIRCSKTWYKSQRDIKPFKTLENASNVNAFPYK